MLTAVRTTVRKTASATTATLVLVLAACGGGASDEASDTDGSAGNQSEEDQSEIDEIELRVTTTIGGPDHFNNTPTQAYLDAVEEASGGRITHEFLYANAVVPPEEVGQAVADGVVDMATVVGAYTPATYPVDNWISNLAFAGELGAPATVMEKSAAGLEWWWSNDQARENDWENNGLVPMTPGVSPIMSYDIICNEPVTNLEEAQGKQVRTGGEAWANTVEALGMTAVTMPGAEMYEALQRGVVDCISQDTPSMIESSLWEVAKQYTPIGMPGYVSWGLFFSQSTWDELSEATKDLLWEQLPVYLEKDAQNAIELQHQFFTEGADMGVEFHQPDAELADAVEEYQQGVVDNIVDQAPEVIDDPQALVDDYLAKHEKWADIIGGELGYESVSGWQTWASEQGSELEIDLSAYGDRVMDEFLAEQRPE